MARQKLSLNFGGGVDRKTGIGAVDPDAMYDLRNVYLFKGRTMLRRGMARVLDIGWGTDIIGIFSVRAQGLAAIIVYDDVSGDVRLYLVDGALETASFVDTVWSGISGAATTPPVVSGDDLYNKLVLAHAEPIFAQRQPTRVFDVNAFTITDLTSDLDRSGVAETVRFFGVKKHLNSLVGWGYGTGSDEDSPHTARISKPGEPTVFVPESYLQLGAPGDPILDAVKSGPYLELFKAKESYVLKGNGPKTWDFDMVDDSYGLMAPKLCVTVVDTAYRWSLDGPRVSRGGASEDLEMPLNLTGPLADAIADEEEGFAYYDATENEVVFVFGPWAYVLHLKDGRRRWSFREYGVWLQSAGRIYEGGGATLSLAEALLTSLEATDTYETSPFTGSPTGFDQPEPQIVVNWTLSGSLVGTEDVQIWARSNFGGAGWVLLDTVPATDLTARVDVDHWLTSHDIALRVVIGGVPGAGYTAGPDAWPATARDSVITEWTDTLTQPFLFQDSLTFERISATEPTMQFVMLGPGKGVLNRPELTYLAEVRPHAGGAWTPRDVHQTAIGPTAIIYDNADVNVSTYDQRLSIIGPDATIGPIENTGGILVEPAQPTNLAAGPDQGGLAGGHIHNVHADPQQLGVTIEVRARHLPTGAYAGWSDDAGPGVDLNVVGGAGLGTPGVDDGDLEYSARAYVTAFAVTDRSSEVTDTLSPDP